MLKFMAILLIIFGIWGIIENITFFNLNIEHVDDSPYLQQVSQNNHIVYKIIKTLTLFNRLIAILPFICGILILWKKYEKAYFVAKIIFVLKITLLPFLLTILAKSFLYEANLIKDEAVAIRANIFAFSLLALSYILVMLVYIFTINLLNKIKGATHRSATLVL